MASREFLMKAQTQKNDKYNVLGWWCSEKLDGVRAFWDGGISRGVPKTKIPWANNKSKDDRFVVPPISTGLWSSYGNPIFAPDWWLDALPKISLDGELFIDRRMFQTTTSIVSKLIPDDSMWQRVKLHCFDTPPYPMVFANGKINNVHFQKEMDLNCCMDFVRSKIQNYSVRFYTLRQAYELLCDLPESDSFRVVHHSEIQDRDHMEYFIDLVSELQGEGVMFRRPGSYWEPKRSHQIVKLKPYLDGEGTVTGYTWGKETDKGSKLLGMMGNLILNYQGKRLELSGFSDSERVLTFYPFPDGRNEEQLRLVTKEPYWFPGKEVSRDWFHQTFRIGTTVTFRYRELSDDGVPKEARFDRIRFGHA